MMLPQVFGLIRDLFPPRRDGQGVGRPRPRLGPLRGARPDRRRPADRRRPRSAPAGARSSSINLPVGAFVAARRRHRFLPGRAPAERVAPARRPRHGARRRAAPCCWSTRWSRAASWAGRPGSLAHAGRLGARARRLRPRTRSRRQRAGATPLVEPSVFRNRSYVSGVAFAIVFLGAMGGLCWPSAALLQIGLGYSPIEASLTSAPYALGGFVGSAIGGMTMAKLGRPCCTSDWSSRPSAWSRCTPCSSRRARGVGALRLHRAAARGRHRDGHGLRAAVRHHHRRRGGPRGRLGVGYPRRRSSSSACRWASPGSARCSSGCVGDAGRRAPAFVAAAEPTILVTVALLAAAFAIGFRLPKHAASPDRVERGLVDQGLRGERREQRVRRARSPSAPAAARQTNGARNCQIRSVSALVKPMTRRRR